MGSSVQVRRRSPAPLAPPAKDLPNALVPHEPGPIHACHKSIPVLRLARPNIAPEHCYITHM